jgi:LacI family transcriptional regulator
MYAASGQALFSPFSGDREFFMDLSVSSSDANAALGHFAVGPPLPFRFSEFASMSSRPRKVALLVETSKSLGRGILRGIHNYARDLEHWSICLEPCALYSSPPAWLRGWKGDGIIAHISDAKTAQLILEAALPTINLGLPLTGACFPRIEPNPRSVAQMAARHFLERGFRHIGFCGDCLYSDDWSTRFVKHLRHVLRQVKPNGLGVVERHLGNLSQDWDADLADLSDWIEGLPKPIGLVALNDSIGMRVLDACRSVGVMVPEHVAVLGLEDDEVVCSMARPPLSSISTNAETIGFRAAELLDKLMCGAEPPNKIITVEPIRVVTRQSTDVREHVDEVVAKAVTFIRSWATDGINVDDVLREVDVSRSSLDRRFKSALGRTPHEEIVRAQLSVAMQLLIGTDLTLNQIAVRSGFRHAPYMGAVFRRELKMTAGEYRQFYANTVPTL